MFGIFGNKKESSNPTLQHDASILQTEIQRIQNELSTILEYKGRATKDERTTIVTSSLNAFKKVDTFLKKVVR